VLAFVLTVACTNKSQPKAGTVLDEARTANRSVESLGPATEDYFHDMDGGIQLTADEVKGRNMWLVWTGGNDRLWDRLVALSVGNLDFLKTLSSHPGLKFNRDNRWNYLGLANEPCFEKATGPDPQRYGLWLDKRSANCPPDPFENQQKYPGVQVGARGKNLPLGSYYGWATGIVGLRLFPNPDFDEAAAKKWNPERFYTDAAYYNSKDLVRPYRAQSAQAARGPGTSEMGKPVLQCRRPVFLDRSHIRLEPGQYQLRLAAVPHLAPGLARHVAGIRGQHQQSANHECLVSPGAAPQAGIALW
jgi:hypothetical protein